MNHKFLVVYKSQTGFTQRYGQWIAQALDCPALPLDRLTAADLDRCETVIFGTRAHAGRIDGWQQVKDRFLGKRLVLFVTGAAPNQAEDTIAQLWKGNLTPQELAELPHFYMQSGLCYEKMSRSDRLMMKVAGFFIKLKKPRTPEEEAFQHAFLHSHDIAAKEYIAPLVEFLSK